jgi:hypothetical protein
MVYTTDLINAVPGNSSVNTVQHATIDEAVVSMSSAPRPVLVTDQWTRNLTRDTVFSVGSVPMNYKSFQNNREGRPGGLSWGFSSVREAHVTRCFLWGPCRWIIRVFRITEKAVQEGWVEGSVLYGRLWRKRVSCKCAAEKIRLSCNIWSA